MNDAFFKAMVLSSNDIIIGKDLNGQIVSWNKTAEKIYGYSSSEMIGQSIELIVPEDRMAEMERYIKAVKKGISVEHFETIRIKRDGTEIKVSMSLSPINNDKGELIGVASISRAVPFISQEQEKFELAVEAAPNGILMIDNVGKMKLVNTRLENMFGYTRGELLGKSVEMLIPASLRKKNPENRKKYFSHPKTCVIGAEREFYGLRSDGSHFPVEIVLNPLQTNEGTFVFASVMDITERKRLTQRFELAVEASPTGMIMLNRAGEIELINSQISKMFGYEKKELLGLEFSHFSLIRSP